MRLILLSTLAACAALAGLAALAGAGWPLARAGSWPAWPARLQLAVALLLGMGGLCGLLAWRVLREDRVARVELARCREHQARSHADLALAESDLLMDRLGARRDDEPGAELALIRADLLELQRCNAHDNPVLAARMELLCARVDRVVQAVCDARSG
ncbi:hypothetical protein [uncultured Massilia sp.]|uniref:hypothetical protein n=1 Tax=uncultured Massilia sp. TaxID=169973 RepID=UPI0025E7F9FD|nr:hypothetical protein [uncultured Massilia sp.]